MREREDGIAYGLIAIIIFLIAAGLLYILMAPMVNTLTGAVNQGIAAKELSIQTVNAYSFNETMFRYGIPLATLAGAIIFAVVRALYRRRMEGYG